MFKSIKVQTGAAAILLAATCGLSSAAFAGEDEFTFEANMAWESEYIFRGAQVHEFSFQPSLQIDYNQFYIGTWGAVPLSNSGTFNTEVDFYAGLGVPVTEQVDLDFGATFYTFPSVAGATNFETFAGITYDNAVSPSLYVFYDFDLNAVTIEGSAGHSWPLADQLSFDVGVNAGAVYTQGAASDYYYYGVTADVSHEINDRVSASFGARWTGSTQNTFFSNVVAGNPVWNQDNSISFGVALTVTR